VQNSSSASGLDALGRYALRYVRAGQTLGLGTGRAASAFIRAVAAAQLGICGVPTSEASAALARSLGIELVELKAAGRIATDFDGADEVDPRLNLIKGLGGAMVREKIVAVSSRRRIFLVGEEKLVKRLGARGNLPVEVVPFALAYITRELKKLGLKPKTRVGANGGEFVSDNGNYVIDCGVRAISNPAHLERELLVIPGVVGTGLFVGLADLVLVAMRDGTIKTFAATRAQMIRPT